MSSASVGAIKGAAEFADFGITVQGTDPSSSRLDRSDGGVQPIFEGVAVNNVAAGSSNQGMTPTRSSLDRFDGGVQSLFENEDFPPIHTGSANGVSSKVVGETVAIPVVLRPVSGSRRSVNDVSGKCIGVPVAIMQTGDPRSYSSRGDRGLPVSSPPNWRSLFAGRQKSYDPVFVEDVWMGFLVGSLFSMTEVISHFHDQL